MFDSLRRLFSTRHKPAKRPRTQLQLETLETREVPAHLCGLHGQPHPHGLLAPGSRATEPASFVASGSKWAQPGGLGSRVTITYSYSNLLDGGLGLGDTELVTAVEEALARWAAVAPLNFVEVADSGPAPSDASYNAASTPMIRFGHHAIDGIGRPDNLLGHASSPFSTTDGQAGDLHFDSSERWSVAPDALAPAGSVDFLEVATHEIGHALGLDHEPPPANGGNAAIMNPSYRALYNGLGTSFLFADDINGIRAIYGSGRGVVTLLPSAKVKGDFNGDGRDDVATFETRDGTWHVGLSNGSRFVTTQWADFATNSGWRSQVVGDFNGDGRDDIANFHPGNGTWWVARSTGSGFVTTQWADFTTNSGWTSQVVGDFNADGRDDIANFHPGNGTWWVARSTGSAFSTTQWADFATNSGWTSQVVGDFNADGRDDIANFHPGNGTWWVARSTGSGFVTTQWADFTTNSGWTSQVVGDFDGDGRDDIANFHPGNGTWWVARSTGSAFSTTQWADFATNSGWTSQLVGDFNGDGRDDIANFHPGNGTWWVARSTGSGFVTTQWADFDTNSGWYSQLAGDFDGDGRDDIANFHPGNGTWWVARSTGSTFSTTLWRRG